MVQAYILIQTEVGKAAQVAKTISEITGVIQAEDVTGPYDVIVRAEAESVDELGRLNEAGMDGMIMGFLDYNEEMKYFGERVLPLMKEAGLRH